MRLRVSLFILVTVWALCATIGYVYERSVAKQMLSIAETEYDRRVVEEKFFDEFLGQGDVFVIDPHTSPFAGEKVEEAPKNPYHPPYPGEHQ